MWHVRNVGAAQRAERPVMEPVVKRYELAVPIYGDKKHVTSRSRIANGPGVPDLEADSTEGARHRTRVRGSDHMIEVGWEDQGEMGADEASLRVMLCARRFHPAAIRIAKDGIRDDR